MMRYQSKLDRTYVSAPRGTQVQQEEEIDAESARMNTRNVMKMQVPEKHKADCDVHEQRLHEERRGRAIL